MGQGHSDLPLDICHKSIDLTVCTCALGAPLVCVWVLVGSFVHFVSGIRVVGGCDFWGTLTDFECQEALEEPLLLYQTVMWISLWARRFYSFWGYGHTEKNWKMVEPFLLKVTTTDYAYLNTIIMRPHILWLKAGGRKRAL